MRGNSRPSVLDGVKHPDSCDSSVAALFAAHASLISKLVRSAAWQFPGIDLQDLMQIARVAIWQAALRFDPRRGAPFEHFASVCIKNALRKFVAANVDSAVRVHADDDELLEAVELDGAQPEPGQRSRGTGETEGHFIGDPGRGAAYQHCLLNEIARHVASLQPQLQEVYYQHVLGGVSQPILARTLGVSQQRVAKLKAELCRHLMEVLRDPEQV
jgi:RNA polymerase sigma factor (sigma-70 family)